MYDCCLLLAPREGFEVQPVDELPHVHHRIDLYKSGPPKPIDFYDLVHMSRGSRAVHDSLLRVLMLKRCER